jgi:hypothetical protein
MTDKHTPLDDIPENLNFLSPLGFKFIIKRTPHVNYTLVKCNIPGISIDHVKEITPFVPLIQPGDHGEFQPLTVSFRVDEDLQNWLEINSWMRNIAKMDDFAEYAALEKQPEYGGFAIRSEILLVVLTSAKTPKIAFTFHDCMPASLTDCVFDAAMTDVNYLTATVTFAYSNYDYDRSL